MTTALVPPTKHYKSDYQCFAVSYEEDGKSTAASYLIDTFNGPAADGVNYDGPEPLNTLLVGLHEALAVVKEQKIPGDKFGVLGFDQSATINKRCISSQNLAGEKVCAKLVSPRDSAVEEFLNAVDIEQQNHATVQKRIKDYVLFPRIDAMSNLPEALLRAQEMLDSAANDQAYQGFVVVFTDGVSTCTSDRNCDDNEAAFQASLNEVQNIYATQLSKRRTKLFFVLTGDYVKPHTLLAPSAENPGSCMAEAEAQGRGLSFVDPRSAEPDFQDAVVYGKTNSFFSPANALYSLVSQSKGSWFPLRNCCKDSLGNCSDVRTALKTLCKAASPKTVEVSSPYLGPNALLPQAIPNTPYSDEAGRLVCDPQGRSRREQIKDYIRELIGEADPIIIVGEQK